MPVQAASIVTLSPAQARHVHVVSLPPKFEATTQHGGHLFVAAQQPLLPGLEPSAHVAAEAKIAAKTSMSLPTRAIDLIWGSARCERYAKGP